MKQAPLCGCGAGICLSDVVNTEGPNFGRRFYVCPIKKGQGACSYFVWQDADSNISATGVKFDDGIVSPASILNNSINTSPADSDIGKESQDADLNIAAPGLKLYESSIPPVSILTNSTNISPADSDVAKESQDADSNIAAPGLKLDESSIPPVSILTNSINISPSNSDLGQKSQDAGSNLAAPRLKLDESAESPVSILTYSINISSANSDLGKESQPIKFGRERNSKCSHTVIKNWPVKEEQLWVGELIGSEDISDEPLTRYRKRIRRGESESDRSPSSSSFISQFIPLESSSRNCLTLAPRRLKKEIHHGQMGSGEKHQTNEETSSLLQIQGWWGRLVFPPSKCLTEPAPKPLFCCTFPSFDPIFVPPNVCLLDETAALPSAIVPESACSQPNSIMKNFVSEAFIKSGEQLQTDLLNILRSLDVKTHEIMRLGANAAFEALDNLGIDNKKFRQAVKEFILRATVLAKIDQSISCNQSCQKLADRLNRQKLKLKLKEMRDAEAKVIDSLSVCKKRAAYLTEEISHLKEKLYKAEAELYCCKVDSTAMESHVSQISKDKVKAEQSLRRTGDKLKNAWQLHKQMEAEKQSAKTAFEKTKFLIWGDD